MKTTIAIGKQTRKYDLQANLLLQHYILCSDDMKCAFFQAYCTNMYCCQLWFKLCFKSSFCTSKPYSANIMFVLRGFPTFAELLWKYV